MRQVTGSNHNSDVIKISVRLRSDGVPFLVPQEIVEHDGGNFEIELLTKRAMLIPNDVEESGVDEELSKIGIVVGDDEVPMLLRGEDIAAIVVVPAALREAITNYKVEYSTPLLRGEVNKKPHMLLDSIDGVTTIKVFGSGELLFADVYETPSTASVIYWVQRLCAAMKLGRDIPLYIYRGNGALRRLLSRNFKSIFVCE